MANQSNLVKALQISFQFGYTIVIPLVLLALLGRYLDKRFDTHPWLLIGGIIISIFVSSFGLVMQFKRILAEMDPPKPEQKDPQEKNPTNTP